MPQLFRVLRDAGLYFLVNISTVNDDTLWPIINQHILSALPSTITLPHNPNFVDGEQPEYDTLDWELLSTRKSRSSPGSSPVTRSFIQHEIVGHKFTRSVLENSFKGALKFENPLEPHTLHIIGAFFISF